MIYISAYLMAFIARVRQAVDPKFSLLDFYINNVMT